MLTEKNLFLKTFSNILNKIKPDTPKYLNLQIQPPEDYNLIHWKNLGKHWFFRIIQNKKSGLIYFEYGKEYWKELDGGELICTPINQEGEKLSSKEVKELLQPFFWKLESLAKQKSQTFSVC